MNELTNASNEPAGEKVDETHAWDRVKEALRRDWDQTRNDFGAKFGQDLNQNVANTVAQATGNEPIPPRHMANASTAWADEVAVRFGYSSAQSPNYRGQGAWNPALELWLKTEWETLHSGRDWADVRMAVRYGWMRSKGDLLSGS